MNTSLRSLARSPWLWMIVLSLVVAAAYLPGLSGGWFFDDYPNIVDNRGVQPGDASIASLTSAALSSPSSEFKRPLASLSFAFNYLASGLNPEPMKATNVVIHLLNGWIAFLLVRLLMAGATRQVTLGDTWRAVIVAFLWMALPINLTAVLYVVQRMESLANLFVLLGLFSYASGRRRMLADGNGNGNGNGCVLAAGGMVLASAVGILAKETAILTPLYALLIEATVFRWKRSPRESRRDGPSRRVIALFIVTLALPLAIGAVVIVPRLLADATWAPRPFTLSERLFTECRIVASYLRWTLLPSPGGLSFYHDDLKVSTGWLAPWTTLASAMLLAALAIFAIAIRRRLPLVALGIGFFFACHLLTATIIPLELVYEHRNYFASLGIIIVLVTLLAGGGNPDRIHDEAVRPRAALLVIASFAWLSFTAFTAYKWGGDPLRLPTELAVRGPMSPRAQYGLGRVYVIATGYKPDSPYLEPAYKVLEKSASLPRSSTLSEQALIFLNARMHLPIKDEWWASMRKKLEIGPVAIEDESAIMSLAACKMSGECDLDPQRVLELYVTALSHDNPHARLIGAYSDFAWTALQDQKLGYDMAKLAAQTEPNEPAYHITAARQALALNDLPTARLQIAALERLNVGGRLSSTLSPLRSTLANKEHDAAPVEAR
ncbi:hypothetical protein [Luteibacter sp. 9133]|uniref:hypothetical protein n=1 Tax=Luteibacter sp. 9133 TaxID=1500891 RepID=UPI000AF22316|nr:hypothetical protein [Luteibacter sp. 9133]